MPKITLNILCHTTRNHQGDLFIDLKYILSLMKLKQKHTKKEIFYKFTILNSVWPLNTKFTHVRIQ